VLRPAADLRLDLRRAQVGADLLGHLRSSASRCGACSLISRWISSNRFGNSVPERQVLELPLDRVHAEAVRQRRQDLERLLGLLLLLLAGQEGQRAHVVQPVGQLDHEDPRVLGHRDDHLADRLGLRRVAELDLVELGDAVDEQRDLAAELAAHVLQRVVAVFDGVVQQRGGQRRGVHAEVRRGSWRRRAGA
jgi:hypothetical protein